MILVAKYMRSDIWEWENNQSELNSFKVVRARVYVYPFANGDRYQLTSVNLDWKILLWSRGGEIVLDRGNNPSVWRN